MHHPGHTFTHLYAIQRGALKTHGTSQTGKEMIHGLYLKNEVYGSDAIYNKRYVYDSTALTETIVCEIPYQNFLKLLHLEPSLLALMLDLMSRQIAAGAYLQFSSAQQRLCAWLLDMGERLRANGEHPSFLLPITYQDIGHYLGLTAETVSRIFTQLRCDKIISIQNKRVSFLLIITLKHLAVS